MANARIPKPRTIYNNYSLWETYPDEKVKEYLRKDNEEDEITDEDIWRWRYARDKFDWENAQNKLKHFFRNNGNKWMIFGEVGRWDGVYKAGTLFDTFEDFFYDATKDCNYIHLYDENGHLYLTCSHHDGTCHYEIKEVTDKGVQYLENWEYGSWSDKRNTQYVHTQIFNRYSRLPRFAERVYGRPKVEYQPVTKSALIDKLNNQAKSFYS